MARNPSSMGVVIPLGVIGGLVLIGDVALAINGHFGSSSGNIITTTVVMSVMFRCTY